ncbi:hypothetical protein VKT23_015516 [Stygiomarasmius scandens]|uniref:BTB domain-containing protein n=1 Tax=Marasmiellus scandens TaxID=2682957 RepID=A0ABR1IX78_9AGAR
MLRLSCPTPALAPNGYNDVHGFRMEDWIDANEPPIHDLCTPDTFYHPLGDHSVSSPGMQASTSFYDPSFFDINANHCTTPSEPILSTDNSLNQALGTPEHELNPSLDRDKQDFDSLTLSTAFQEVPNPSLPPPDLILLSSDGVVFYVNEDSLLRASDNSFSGLLPIAANDKIERVRHLHKTHSSELNIILHILYNMDCAQYNPQLSTIISAIDHLPQYGYTPKQWISSKNFIYHLLLVQAPLYPLDIYCLCGKHELYELATAVSPHLLSLDLSTLTDEHAERMGSVLLARLFKLQRARVAALLNSIMPPPPLHIPTEECGYEDQQSMSSAWTMTAAYFSWSAKPGELEACPFDISDPLCSFWIRIIIFRSSVGNQLRL